MYKRITASLLALAVALSLAGCSDKSDKPEAVWPGETVTTDAKGDATSQKPGEATATSQKPGETTAPSNGDVTALEACEALADAFMKEYDNSKELEDMGLQHHAYYAYGRGLRQRPRGDFSHEALRR